MSIPISFSSVAPTMPPRILRDILVIDKSELARNMYNLLFTPQTRFRVRFADEYQSLFKKSRRLRPDLLIINSNFLPRGADISLPCAAILISSKDRSDVRENVATMKAVAVVEKPFYPYDLISVANRLIVPFKGRKRSVRRSKRG